MSREAYYAAGQVSRQPPRSGFENEACHEYSSTISRACNLTAPQNHTRTVSYSHGLDLLRALCLASGTTEIRTGSDKTAEVWRFENEARRGTDAYDLGATPPRSHAHCELEEPGNHLEQVPYANCAIWRLQLQIGVL